MIDRNPKLHITRTKAGYRATVALNPPYSEDTGRVAVHSYDFTCTSDGRNIELVVSDCYRGITLDFSYHNEKLLEERKRKLKRLREALDFLETQLNGAYSSSG